MAAQPYPWTRIDRVSREALGPLGQSRRELDAAAVGDALSRTLSEVLETQVGVLLSDFGAATAEGSLGVDCVLRPIDESAQLLLSVEPALADAMLSRALGRPSGIVNPASKNVSDRVVGALGAVFVEVARRSGHPTIFLGARAPDQTWSLSSEASATVNIGDRAYAARARVDRRERPTRDVISLADFAAGPMGDTVVALAVVAAQSVSSRLDAERLAPGDAWMPGEGWSTGADGLGAVALSSPSGEEGVRAELRADGSIALGRESVSLAADTEEPLAAETTLEDAVLTAPVLVRVELGAVSMTARDWAALRPGDVIASGHRVAEPVVLRVAGREIARGELVDIDGELGVRVLELDEDQTT